MKLLHSRVIKYAFFGIVLIVLVVVGVEIQWAHRKSSLAKSWRSEMVSSLTSSQTYEGVNGTLSRLGVMLGEPDEAWVAIDYQDTHNEFIVSSAVARMRNGELFISEEHFCGKFSGYQDSKDQIVRFEKMIQESSDSEVIQLFQEQLDLADEGMRFDQFLFAIDSESDPVKQRELLIKLGFQPMD